VEENAAKGESAAGRGVDKRRGDEVAEEALFPHLLPPHVEAPDCTDGVTGTAAEDDELAVTDEEGKGAAGGVEGREFVDLAGVGVEVKGVMMMALVHGGEIAGDRDRDSTGSPGVGDTGEVGFDCSTRLRGQVEAIEVDLNGGGFRSRLDRGGAKEWSLRFGRGRSALDGLDGEEVGIGREDDGSYAAILRREKRVLGKGLAGGEVGERSEGSKGVADT
jgi:hypothetical protein